MLSDRACEIKGQSAVTFVFVIFFLQAVNDLHSRAFHSFLDQNFLATVTRYRDSY